MLALLKVLGALLLLAVVLVTAHFAVIEVGREVVTLRTRSADGRWKETRLWCVDDGRSVWLHSAGEDWLPRFAGDGVVELLRGGQVRRYHAQPMPGPHPHVHELLRAKYGMADRWVRFLGPDNATTVAVRLDPVG